MKAPWRRWTRSFPVLTICSSNKFQEGNLCRGCWKASSQLRQSEGGRWSHWEWSRRSISRQAPTCELRNHPVSLMLKKRWVYGWTFVANNSSAPHRCLTHLSMSKLLSLETSSARQPCLGHPLAPAWLRLQKCFITNSNYHSGFIIAFPSGFCLCCLETMLKATSTRSITHLGTNNWDEGRWSREDLFAEGRFSTPR